MAYLATITDPATLELSAALMDCVHDGADALLTMRGHLAEQHRYIGGLPFNVRLMLYMQVRSYAGKRIKPFPVPSVFLWQP